MLKQNLFSLRQKMSCPLCEGITTQLHDTQSACLKNCDKFRFSSSTNNEDGHREWSSPKQFESLKLFQKHLREHHSDALFPDKKQTSFQQQYNNSLCVQRFSRQTRKFVRLTSSLDFFHRKDRFASFLFTCTSQSNPDTISALCRLYARIACGLVKISSKNDNNNNNNNNNNSAVASCPLIFIDFANQPDIFEIFEQIDPGADFFLKSRKAIIIVLWEPRVSIDRLVDFPFATNSLKAGRIFVHQCRRDRESGDLAMADLIARISFEVSETIIRGAEDIQPVKNTRNGKSSNNCSSTAARYEDIIKLHIVGNDLRHRRCLQDLISKDAIVGHHAFENTNHHWCETLRNLLFKCLPCACGAVVPPNSKFPHEEMSLYIKKNNYKDDVLRLGEE